MGAEGEEGHVDEGAGRLFVSFMTSLLGISW